MLALMLAMALLCPAPAIAADLRPLPEIAPLPDFDTLAAESRGEGLGEAPPGGTLQGLVRTLFGESTETVDIIILLTVLTLLPSILIMITGFTRIIIVLSFVRNALGMQQTPPNQVLVGLALFLTLFVMRPVFSEVYQNAYVPYTEGAITQEEFIGAALAPTRNFMLQQTRSNDLDFFIGLAKVEVTAYEETPTSVLIPSFLISEIKQAFQMGFFIYLPFVVIDMVVSSTLMAMGMMMLPPAMISLPFKVLLFVMVDGWQLVIGTLMRSFN
jgi:flagellar biosynthetic protein FliP